MQKKIVRIRNHMKTDYYTIQRQIIKSCKDITKSYKDITKSYKERSLNRIKIDQYIL